MAKSVRFIAGVFLAVWRVISSPDDEYCMGGAKRGESSECAESRLATGRRTRLRAREAGEKFLTFWLVGGPFRLGYKWGYSLRISKQLPWPSVCV